MAKHKRISARLSFRSLKVLVFLGVFSGLCGPAAATSVLQISFAELCSVADIIVDGRVVQIDVREDADTPFIWTHVTIEVIELIESEFDGDRIELAFLGGSVGERSMQVSQMTVPQLGERGIFFIESRVRRQIHPLLGWQQGHFRIESGPDGTEQITASRRRVVSGVSKAQSPQRGALSDGIAAGVQIRSEAAGESRAMRPDEFKAAIRDARVWSRTRQQ